MNLSKILSKKFPTILGLLFLGAGLAIGIFLLSTGTGGFFPRATPETTPRETKVTNVSSDSFTVSFLTDSSTPGFVKFSTDASRLSQQAGDDRDQLSGTVGEFTTHHITVRGLEASTTYYFTVGTANRYAYTDNGKPYSVKTAPKIGGAPEALTAYGTVVTSGGSPAKDAIVYMTVDGSTPLSTLVKSSGSYAISLALARTTDLSSFAPLGDSAKVDILVQGKDRGQTSRAVTFMKDTQPISPITLGQNHDFTVSADGGTEPGDTPADSAFSQEQLNPPTETDLTSASSSGAVTQDAAGAIVFLNPMTDGQQFTDATPELKGTAPASTEIQITVNSTQQFTDTMTTDASGNWSYTPPEDLEAGEHTVTVTYTDSTGVLRSQRRTFIVAAQTTAGKTSLPAVTASPSATPKPSPSPSPTSSASARVSTPSTSSGVPTAGSVEQTYFLLLLGAGMLIAGLYLWQKTAKAEDLLDGRN